MSQSLLQLSPALTRRTVLSAALLILSRGLAGCGGSGSGVPQSPPPPPPSPSLPEALLMDFGTAVTANDRGFNAFAGNVGELNGQFITTTFEAADGGTMDWHERLRWDFTSSSDLDIFTGRFMSLFGLTDTLATYDGRAVESTRFPEYSLNLDCMDGALIEPGGPRSVQGVCIRIGFAGPGRLHLRLELGDVSGGSRFTRVKVEPSTELQTICWKFRETGQYSIAGGRDLDIQQAKTLGLVIERRHLADGVRNPDTGEIVWKSVTLQIDRIDPAPADDEALLDLIERRAAQYFIDWVSRKPGSMGIPQDRATFSDLLTVGGLGFAFALLPVLAERGWLTREEAAARVLGPLRVIDNPSAFGPETIGRIGYRGFLYHFLGVDGRRKLNFNRPETTFDESINTVELSTIDTALAIIGICVAQQYFDAASEIETEIRQRSQAIYDRVEWPYMLEPTTKQFYLGAKPADPPAAREQFQIVADDGVTFYSGKPDAPVTLNHFTAEALIVILAAAGSSTHPVPSAVYTSFIRARDPDGFTRSFPGALFTYHFLSAFMDPAAIVAAPPAGQGAEDWSNNTRMAYLRVMAEALGNPRAFAAYGPDGWGIDAAEGPADDYHAYGADSVAVRSAPEQDGTLAYYPVFAAMPFGADLRSRAVDVARKAIARGHLHARFGLADAYNDDISQGALHWPTASPALRHTGAWVNRTNFAIDAGPLALGIENARTQLVWRLAARNANLQRGLVKIAAAQQIVIEADSIGGAGVRLRSNASGGRTLWLGSGQAAEFDFDSLGPATYRLMVRYSNDNFGSGEFVRVLVDSVPVGQFAAEDTGNFGSGWNVFRAATVGLVLVGKGIHKLRVEIAGGDGYGIEIDQFLLERTD